MEVVLSTLESMNRSLFEEHLQKLYYRVDGVVYRNETRQLDERLDQVESDLLGAGNSSDDVRRLAADLGRLEASLELLNASTADRLEEQDATIKTIGDRTEEGLEDLGVVLKATRLVHGGMEMLSSDLRDVSNSTSRLGRDMAKLRNSTEDSLDSLRTEVSGSLSTLVAEVDALGGRLRNATDEMDAFRLDAAVLVADVALVENRVEEIRTESRGQMKDMQLLIANVTEAWHALSSDVAKLKSDPDVEFEELRTVDESELVPSKNGGNENKKTADMTLPCSAPSKNDSHLLVQTEGVDGELTLRFTCQPIGRYALHPSPTPLRCVQGAWRGLMPTCERLMDEEEVEVLTSELATEKVCSQDQFETLPDPTSCSHYFKCYPGFWQRKACPPDQHFSSRLKMCQNSASEGCQVNPRGATKRLAQLIPTILIDPDNVDRPYGLMGTHPSGRLIVHPRTTFQLHCLFPPTQWGAPTWTFEPQGSGAPEPMIRIPGSHRVSVKVTSASASDSGVYSCRTPFGYQNSLVVEVKEVVCPPVKNQPHIEVFYRPHPDGQSRIMSTPVHFSCGGEEVATALCRPDGTWSEPPPTPEECPSKKTQWGCPPITTETRPYLTLEKDDQDKSISFKCSGHHRLVGISFTRCYQGEWTHTLLPKCIPFGF